MIAERARSGLVAGVDPSKVMLRQAAQRNREAVVAGRVQLRLGSASALPYADGSFTKACAIHSLYFWLSVEEGLRELHRVLAPGGLLVLAVRMQRAEGGPFNPSRYEPSEEDLGEVVQALGSVGFRDVGTRRREIGRQMIVAVLGRR
jgi:ubiquinone/menaquinone biosynthesis C-methylase UbiE